MGETYIYHKSIMVRASKTASTTSTVPVSTPVVAASVVTPVESGEKVKVKRTIKPKKEVDASVPVVTPVVDTTVDAVVSTEVDVTLDKTSLSDALLAEISLFNQNFQVWTNSGAALKNNVKNITKISARVSKSAEKTTKRKKNSKSKPSGFEKPTLISDELAVFFERPLGSRMARTEVSKMIHQYVTGKNLQNAENRRIIHPDPKLKDLLKVNNDELTYFNLQKFLKFHFKKDVPVATA
jgi:hypothetical protein